MNKYNVRVYLTSYVDIEVEADSEEAATEYAINNSDEWFAAGNQILEHIDGNFAEVND